jgi:hypothetical protein
LPGEIACIRRITFAIHIDTGAAHAMALHQKGERLWMTLAWVGSPRAETVLGQSYCTVMVTV